MLVYLVETDRGLVNLVETDIGLVDLAETGTGLEDLVECGQGLSWLLHLDWKIICLASISEEKNQQQITSQFLFHSKASRCK